MSQKQANFTTSFSLGTNSYNAAVAVQGNADFAVSESVPAAQPGTLTTNTSSTAGTLTMTNSDHGITTGARLDIYWDGGVIYGALVGTVSGTSVPFTEANGSDVPSTSTAIVACVPVSAPFPAVIANLLAFAAQADFNAQITIVDGSGTVDYYNNFTPPNNGQFSVDFWYTGLGDNPVSGTGPTATIYFSHGDDNAAHVMSASYLTD